jgi:hypothetical protein
MCGFVTLEVMYFPDGRQAFPYKLREGLLVILPESRRRGGEFFSKSLYCSNCSDGLLS